MTPGEFGNFIHPREYSRFVLALIFALPISLALLAVVYFTAGFVVILVLVFAFMFWFASEIAYARLLGNWILVSEHNYPRLKALLDEVKASVGVTSRIDMIVFEQGAFNALMTRFFARRAIFLFSEMLEEGVTDDELRWIIGRFIGYIRARRRMGVLSWAINAAGYLGVFNFFLLPYWRATVYTGDRIGLGVIDGDISTAVSAMNKLIVGRELGYSVNPSGIVVQYRRVRGSFFAFLGRLLSAFPYTIARYVDLVSFAERRYPREYQQFAALNPGFEVAGGPTALLRGGPAFTQEERLSLPGKVGWLLVASIIAVTIGSILWARTFGVPLITMARGGNPFAATPRYEYGAPPSYSEYTPAPPAESFEPPPPPAAPDQYGAFAVSDSTGIYAWSYALPSSQDARQAALNSCASTEQSPFDCRILVEFVNACGTLVYSPDSGVSYGGVGGSESQAQENALAMCRADNYNCQVAQTACSLQ